MASYNLHTVRDTRNTRGDSLFEVRSKAILITTSSGCDLKCKPLLLINCVELRQNQVYIIEKLQKASAIRDKASIALATMILKSCKVIKRSKYQI